MRSSSTGNSGITSCQDCGNKAKKDCSHMRCRTCCKSRGFQCSTHVKSTWVPVARRRQRQQRQEHQHQHHQQYLGPSSATVDYHHLNLPLSLSRTTTTCIRRSPPSGPDGGNFPAEVNSLATFRCIRVSSEDNVVDQYAYQTSINIGGHVFKGILYDQGATPSGTVGGDQSSSAGNSDIQHQFHHHQHQFNIMGSAATTTATAQSGGGPNVLYPPHHPLYSAPFNAFMPGMQFFPHPRP